MDNLLLLIDFNPITFFQSPSFLSALKSFGLAILIWIIGSIMIGKITSILQISFEKMKMDESLRPFLSSLITVLFKIMLMLAVANTLGMDVMSFVAIFSAATFAIGMALQGGLSNFAGGVMVLIFKPFKVGDLISAQGFTGTVKEIQIFNTILVMPDNQRIIVPNGPLSNGPIQHLAVDGKRRVDLTFGIGYGEDIDKARKVIFDVLKACPNVIDPAKTDVFIAELGDSSVNFCVRPWAHPDYYFDVMFYMNENVKKSFDRENVGIPYPTMDINITK